MPSTAYAQMLASVARREYQDYGGVPESDRRLRDRIYKTYLADLAVADPADRLGWKMSQDISSWAWSATFVSWCVLRAGATSAEFDFSIRHAVFTQRAILNADAGTGVFRGRPIDARPPQIGDLIVANRMGGTKGFADARASDNYASHSAIVVDLVRRNGKTYAVTVGGNEGNSVGRTEIELTAAGLVRQRATNPYICVIETLKGDAGDADPLAEAVAGGLAKAFRKHGTFIYNSAATIADYGSPANVAAAMVRAGMSHAWVRIHGRKADAAPTQAASKSLIAALQSAGIAVAGWGWVQGEDPKGEAAIALKALNTYGLKDYIADIEPGHNNSVWTSLEVDAFCAAVRKGVVGSFAVSSFALVDWHEPQLMSAALPHVDAFAPQIYWFNYPNSKMVQQFKRPDGTNYPIGKAHGYAELCLDRWARLAATSPKPLILTGQAYWGESGFSQAAAEAKLDEFLAGWRDFGRIAGLNWWHFGGSTGMSHAMLESITNAALGDKTYA